MEIKKISVDHGRYDTVESARISNGPAGAFILFNEFDSQASPENQKIEAHNSKLAAKMAEKMILEFP